MIDSRAGAKIARVGDIALTLLCGSMRFSPIETELVRLGIAAAIARGRSLRSYR